MVSTAVGIAFASLTKRIPMLRLPCWFNYYHLFYIFRIRLIRLKGGNVWKHFVEHCYIASVAILFVLDFHAKFCGS